MKQKTIYKAIGGLLLAVLLLVTAIPVLQAYAAHENTYTNTGNQRQDIIGVALTQVGYREGWNNDTKYGAWYSTAVGWSMNYQPWCAMFISWCANQAGIPTSALKLCSFADLGGFGITDTFKYSSGRVPQPGDLFTREGQHAGIVYQVDVANNTFVTIEGNTNDSGWDGIGVFIRYHSLTDSRYTFGSPNYTSDHAHQFNTGVESAHPHKEYKQCSICNAKQYTGNTKTVADCTACIQANCSHSYGSWASTGDSQHQHICSICGKVEGASHSWNAGLVTKNATCKEAGLKKQTCAGCGAQRTVEIAKLQTHTYTAWEKVDEETHSRKCLVCDKVDSQAHNCPEEWSTSDVQHWFECADCQELIDLGDHDFNDSCENPCEICGYIREDGHKLHTSWDMSETGHYYGCDACLQQVDFMPHTFSTELVGDKQGHYYPCTTCGYRQTVEAHIPGPEATEEAAQTCTVCDYEIAPKVVHVHNFMPLEYNANQHWGSCECGAHFGPEEHQWDISRKVCASCGMDMQVQSWQTPVELMVLAGIAGLLVIALIVTLTVLLATRKKKVLVEV